MSDTFRPPLFEEEWIIEGRPSTQLYEFLTQIADLNSLLSLGIWPSSRYADLAAVQAAIPSPMDGYTVMFEGQGLGTYNEVAGQWLLSADDTTAVT